MSYEEHRAIQSGEKPATTIRQLVDAQRQNLAAAGFDFSTVHLLLDRAKRYSYVTGADERTEISVVFQEADWQAFTDALDRLEKNIKRVNDKATLAFNCTE